MKNNKKIYDIKKLNFILKKFKNKSIAICPGYFDDIHPGHKKILNFASSICDILIVAVYDDNFYINKDLNFKHSQKKRISNLADIEHINYVIGINKFDHLYNLKLDYVVMGEEFRNSNDLIINTFFKKMLNSNTEIIFHGGNKNLKKADENNSHININKLKWFNFLKITSDLDTSIEKILKKFSVKAKKSALVIGDTIVDRYIDGETLGLSEEAPLVVIKEKESKEYLGGAAKVSLTIKELKTNNIYVSVLGNDSIANSVIKKFKNTKIANYLLKDRLRPTTVKTRYMVNKNKVFKTSKLEDNDLSPKIENQIINFIKKNIKKIKVIVVSDFVYGVITSKLLKSIKKIASENKIILVGDLQCSTQIGDVSKFKNFDVISATEKEVRFAIGKKDTTIEWNANELIKKTNVKNLIYKLGENGFITYERLKNKKLKRIHFPALESVSLDTTGSGDTLLSVLACCSLRNMNIFESSLLAACAAGVNVNKIGNDPVLIDEIKNYINHKNSLI